jgi:hypothetical protein
MSAESFLDSVVYSLNKSNDKESVHGGFDKSIQGEVLKGVARESITACFPLYINYHHWNIAKYKIKPLLGWMTTLDILGYSYQQILDVPYLILFRAFKDRSLSEFKEKQFQMILETCLEIFKDDTKSNREEKLIDVLKKKLENYKNLDGRTADVIPNNTVFIMQLYCAYLLKMIDLKDMNIDEFYVNIFEEEMRRKYLIQINIMDLFTFDKDEYIYNEVKNYEEEKNTNFSDQFDDLSLNGYKKIYYEELNKYLKDENKINVDEKMKEFTSNSKEKSNENSKYKTKKSEEYKIDFTNLNSYSNKLITQTKEYMKKMTKLLNTKKLFTNNEEDENFDFKKLGYEKNENILVLLIQNQKDSKNSTRRSSIERGEVVSPLDFEIAKKYLFKEFCLYVEAEKSILKNKIQNKLTNQKEGIEMDVLKNTNDLEVFFGILIHYTRRTSQIFKNIDVQNNEFSFLKLKILHHRCYKGIYLDPVT